MFMLHQHDLTIGQANGAEATWHIHKLLHIVSRFGAALLVDTQRFRTRRAVVTWLAAHAARHAVHVIGAVAEGP